MKSKTPQILQQTLDELQQAFSDWDKIPENKLEKKGDLKSSETNEAKQITLRAQELLAKLSEQIKALDL